MVVKVFVLLIILSNGGTLQTVTPAPHPFVELDACHDAAVDYADAHPDQRATIACLALPVQIDPAV
jgi:hypothetical protein